MGGAVDPSLDPGDERSGAPAGTWAPFAHPLFAGVWLANTVSNFGGQAQGVGAAWLMTSLTSDARAISLVTGATLAPILLLSLVAGAVADAADRRLVLLAAQGLMFGASVLLAWLAARGQATPGVLIGLTFVIGCGFAFNAPAWQAAVRELVPPEQVPAAVSLNIAGFNLSRTAGPALGGIVVGWGGPQASFVLNALSYLGLLAVLAAWLARPSGQHRPPPEAMGAAILAGLRHAAATQEVRCVLVRVTLFGLALGALLALIPVVVRRLDAGPEGLGLALGCSGGGAVLGALVANPLRQRFGSEPLLRWCTGATAAMMAVVAASDRLLLTAAAEAVTGCATTIVYTCLNLLVQAAAPRPLLGRLLSIQAMAALGGLAVGSWLWGEVAEAASLRAALLGAAAAMAAMVPLGFVLPVADRDA